MYEPRFFPVGAITNTFALVSSNGDTLSKCSSTVTVTDNEKPTLTCASVPVQCYNSNGSYSIPALAVSDNCGIQSTSYNITGATTRSGTGNNASGAFNPGASTITWTVTDVHGNQNTCQSTVTVNLQTINAGCFSATIARTYNPSANTTTFTYNACANGCPAALGYIAFITQTNVQVVSPLNGAAYKTAKYTYKVSVPVGVENGKTIYGIKYDVTSKGGGIKNKGECDKFTFTLAGNIAKEAVTVRFKAGTEVINAAAECHLNSSSVTGATITSAKGVGEQILAAPAKLNISTYPNPYTDRVKFVIQSPVSGPASLEVFNMLGQKVQTVFKGDVEAGRGKSLEYSVPQANRGNLIYILRVGDQQATGKLIHPN